VHPFCNLKSWAWIHAVLVIGLYELLYPTTYKFLNMMCVYIMYKLIVRKTQHYVTWDNTKHNARCKYIWYLILIRLICIMFNITLVICWYINIWDQISRKHTNILVYLSTSDKNFDKRNYFPIWPQSDCTFKVLIYTYIIIKLFLEVLHFIFYIFVVNSTQFKITVKTTRTVWKNYANHQ
jgi:hypothetical protein